MKNSYTYQLRAFTIVEVMIVAVLSIVIAGIAITGLQIFQQQFEGFRDDQELTLKMGNLQLLLQSDFFQAQKVIKEQNTLLFEMPEVSIIYTFTENGIYRTPNFEEAVKTFFPLDKNQLIGTFHNLPIEQGMIDFAELQLTSNEATETLKFSKQYSLKELIPSIYAN